MKSVFIFFVLGVLLTSCGKKDIATEEPLITAEESASVATAPTQPEPELVPTPETPAPAETASVPAVGTNELQNIYFPFDSDSLTPSARDALQFNANWLKQNPKIKIQIEGHCDERGTTEYNLALGERRAETTKRYLIRSGISASRLSTISYGEERPAEMGRGESVWAKNRRAVFSTLN